MRCLLVALLAIPAFASAAEPIKLENVSVHLFYLNAGTLSDDVTSIKGFHARNFIPEGKGIPENERFDTFLVKLAFSSKAEVFEPGVVATVRVLSDEKKLILKRDIVGLYIGESGISHVGIWVEGAECSAPIIEVTSFGRTITKRLMLVCGE